MCTIYLSPSFYPYRVPVFDDLYRQLGKNFKVITLRNQLTENSRTALSLGSFPRLGIAGRFIFFSQKHDEGQESPYGILVTPTLPFVLLSLRPTSIISNNFSLWTFLSVIMGFPTVLFWEGTAHTERTVRSWRKRYRRWLVSKVKSFVVNGKLSRQYLESLDAPSENIIDGGMCGETPPRMHQPISPKSIKNRDHIRFLFVGQMIDRKGISHLLNAMALLKSQVSKSDSFELVLVGDGPKRKDYELLSLELGLDEHALFMGGVLPHDVWKYYEKCHVLVLPTLQDNWPLVVPEAMSMGMPILLSRLAGSVPDLLKEGVNGWVFDPENHYYLAHCMTQYIRNPDLVKKHGSYSITIVQEYTPEKVATRFLRAIELAVK